MSAFDHVASIRPQQLRPGLVSRPVHGEKMTLGLIELDPGTVLPEHQHENEQIGLLIEGSLTFTVADEVAELAPGATWCILANVPHSVVAGPDGAVLVEAFAPHRDDWVALDTLDPSRGRWP